MATTPRSTLDEHVAAVPGALEVEAWVAGLAGPVEGLSDAERIDRIRVLEELKARAAATQAQLTHDLEVSQRAGHAAAGIPAAHQGRGVASQVALARRESPVKGARLLGFATAMTEMPHTRGLLAAGRLSEWRATLLVRETACLSLQDRASVDQALCADPATTHGWGDARLVAETQKLAYALDPHAVLARARRAEAQRCVSLRPAPDTMSRLSALLPVQQGVAVHATLSRHADSLRARGDARTRGQIMADTLVERLTGQSAATAVPVAVNLTVSDETLLAGGHQPAWLAGVGPVPAGLARDLVADAVRDSLATLRRLYVTPATGGLTAMESTARTFPRGLALFLDLRDQTCRTLWCDAPIRHHDHPWAWVDGGPTTAVNGQGLCEQCNHAKQAPGWRAAALTALGHLVETTTPTGHRHRSAAPGLPPPAPLVPPVPADHDRPPRRVITIPGGELYYDTLHLAWAG